MQGRQSKSLGVRLFDHWTALLDARVNPGVNQEKQLWWSMVLGTWRRLYTCTTNLVDVRWLVPDIAAIQKVMNGR